ncbi:MAG TPA: nucleotidyl transferase AbiEii/AbiGii toxin family protein [Oleiagrimonas sp.]|nr:nucleotidyl transferase AbiEii/AbiGii toxin family protein [Oleiagrimonas sp.]
MSAFERPHHRRIARVLDSLDDALLRADHCWFGGGTAIALRHGEYRESVDIDFMISDLAGYRDLRHRLLGARTLAAVTRDGQPPMTLEREVRADQYGIRMFVMLDDVPVKCEIVHEGRIRFDEPGQRDRVGRISTLSSIDMAASKLLANADRWLDTSVFSRDVLDLAMLDLAPRFLGPALDKATHAYGEVIGRDAQRAVKVLRSDPDRLRNCMHALSITLPQAVMQEALRILARRLNRCTAHAP